jgi:hypothetical protein
MIDRQKKLLEYISQQQRGIEIGPYFCPLTPKAQGWNALTVDIFSKTELLEKAKEDPNVPAESLKNIEDVDIIGPAQIVDELIYEKKLEDNFDFIVSSHNFEHIPNPVRFLQACSKILKPGGMLSMAIPDKRCGMDYYRPLSTLAGMLQAFHENRTQPSPEQIFEFANLQSRMKKDDDFHYVWTIEDNPKNIFATQASRPSYLLWRDALSNNSYIDTHCWTFTPSSFMLILQDLKFLDFINFDIVEVTDVAGAEFFVHLKNMRNITGTPVSRIKYYDQREFLLKKINIELSENISIKTDSFSSNIKILSECFDELSKQTSRLANLIRTLDHDSISKK